MILFHISVKIIAFDTPKARERRDKIFQKKYSKKENYVEYWKRCSNDQKLFFIVRIYLRMLKYWQKDVILLALQPVVTFHIKICHIIFAINVINVLHVIHSDSAHNIATFAIFAKLILLSRYNPRCLQKIFCETILNATTIPFPIYMTENFIGKKEKKKKKKSSNYFSSEFSESSDLNSQLYFSIFW